MQHFNNSSCNQDNNIAVLDLRRDAVDKVSTEINN
tara:strand:- start:375 stop:479 length:105 start_codon:yes stop_codon:yes gene_type:complete